MASDTSSARAADPTPKKGSAIRAPRLRAVLLVINLVILLLPLGGAAMVRIYETLLLRLTETELIAQAAFVRALYRDALARELNHDPDISPQFYGPKVDVRFLPDDARLQPVPPTLDRVTDDIFPPAPDPIDAAEPAHRAAIKAGQQISPVLKDAQRTTLAGIRVLDPQGVVVGSTGGHMGLSLANLEEVRQALQGQSIKVMRQRVSENDSPPLESISRGTRVRVYVVLPLIEGGRCWGAVLLSRTPMDVGKALYHIRFHILGVGAALLLVVALLTVLSSVAIVRPVHALVKQARRVTHGERGAAQPLERPVTYEVALLSQAIADMANTLEERADYIQTFAANVSHEFKTPLTSIRGTVELLRDHLDDMTPEERDRFLSNLEKDAERLGRLVTRLLELARAEVLKPGDHHTLVVPVVEALVGAAKARGAAIEAQVEADPALSVVMAPETFESILSNLIENARQHGGPNLVVRLGVQDNKAVIEVQDDGPGISEANLSRVFNRFFTTARSSGGSGLGLSIVKVLVEAHRGQIEVDSQAGKTVFRIKVPVDAQ